MYSLLRTLDAYQALARGGHLICLCLQRVAQIGIRGTGLWHGALILGSHLKQTDLGSVPEKLDLLQVCIRGLAALRPASHLDLQNTVF